MKKLLLITALLTTSVSHALTEEQCRSIEKITEVSMELRNAGISKESTKEFLSKNSPNTSEILAIIIDAVYADNIPKGTNPEIISKIFYSKCME